MITEASKNNNVKAFLKMIRQCEGTAGPNGYNTTYGYDTFSDMSNHPAITGEWKGRQLTAAQCKNAGLSSPCYSTAAGAYQFTKGTWREVALRYNLKDFTPASQDLGAIGLLRTIGVLDLVIAGKISEALAEPKLGARWASLPSATTKQNPKTFAEAKAYYRAAGGQITA